MIEPAADCARGGLHPRLTSVFDWVRHAADGTAGRNCVLVCMYVWGGRAGRRESGVSGVSRVRRHRWDVLGLQMRGSGVHEGRLSGLGNGGGIVNIG